MLLLCILYHPPHPHMLYNKEYGINEKVPTNSTKVIKRSAVSLFSTKKHKNRRERHTMDTFTGRAGNIWLSCEANSRWKRFRCLR
ncbi:50S ribosomal protein L23 domain protein [Aneurinibacillus migulanus]|nr:50S ribosomal protein L23 domain protein [Aneurinibacillus migulanus]